MISIIVLCTVYEVFKNREIANARKEMLESKEVSKGDTQVHEQGDDAAPETDRPLVNDRTTDNMSDFGA
jgi:hypothetical protein